MSILTLSRKASLLVLTLFFAQAMLLSTVVLGQNHSPCDNQSCRVDSLRLNTGFNQATSTLYPVSYPPSMISQDGFWQITSSPDPGVTLGPAYVIPAYSWGSGNWASAPNSQWLSAYDYAGWNSNNINPPVPYVFERCFCVCDSQSLVRLNFQMYVDNGDSVFLDDMFIATYGMNDVVSSFLTPLHVDTTLTLAAGTHCLSVHLYNISGQAMGFDLAGSIKSISVPAHSIFLADTCCQPYGSICGRKIWDKNCNGLDDNTSANPNIEPGLVGWTMVLNPGNIHATTDVNGNFCFEHLSPGTYTVSEMNESGWNQSFPSSGSYTVHLGFGQVAQVKFGNCRSLDSICTDYIGMGVLDSACCKYSFSISSGMGNILSIRYNLTNATMLALNTSPCTPSSTIPTQLFGSTSGILNFNPACTQTMNVDVQADPTTASGEVCVQWTIIYQKSGRIDTCRFDTCYICPRPAESRCDSLSVQPFMFNNIQQDWWTFTITNRKIPTSPICCVKIDISPNPVSQHTGGGLVVDGGARSWTYVGSSGYTSICPIGPPANSTVAFNLGIDNTIGWSGVITLTVVHCDGDTCYLRDTLSARPPRPYIGSTTVLPLDSILVGRITINLGTIDTGTSPVYYIGIRPRTLGVPGANTILAINGGTDPCDSAMLAKGEPCDDWVDRTWVNKAGVLIGLRRYNPKNVTRLQQPEIYLVYRESSNASVAGNFTLTYYGANGRVLAIEDSVHINGAKSGINQPQMIGPGSGSPLGLYPNPTKNEVLISYFLPTDCQYSIELFNASGKYITALTAGRGGEGTSSFKANLLNIPPGAYFVRLTAGDITQEAKLVILR